MITGLSVFNTNTSYEAFLTREVYSLYNCGGKLNSEDSTDMVSPLSPPCSDVLKLSWTHKKGKEKKQQFWVYCEDNQYNYCQARISFPGVTIDDSSRLAEVVRSGAVVVIPHYCATAGSHDTIDLSSGTRRAYRSRDLSLISAEDLCASTTLLEDSEAPVAPNQGSAAAVSIIEHTIVPERRVAFPLGFQSQYIFKNRTEGWFRIAATLTYKNHVIASGKSDVFMFNNPRMTGKRFLGAFKPDEIKLMQCHAIGPPEQQSHWTNVGLSLGHSMERLHIIFAKGREVFQSKSSAKTTVKTTVAKVAGRKRSRSSDTSTQATKRSRMASNTSTESSVVPDNVAMAECEPVSPFEPVSPLSSYTSSPYAEEPVFFSSLESVFPCAIAPLPDYSKHSDDLMAPDALVPKIEEGVLEWLLADSTTSTFFGLNTFLDFDN